MAFRKKLVDYQTIGDRRQSDLHQDNTVVFEKGSSVYHFFNPAILLNELKKIGINVDEVDTIQKQKGGAWEITFKTEESKNLVCQKGVIFSAVHFMPVPKTEVKVNVIVRWLPRDIPPDQIYNIMKCYGKIWSIHMEYYDNFTNIRTGNYVLRMTLDTDILHVITYGTDRKKASVSYHGQPDQSCERCAEFGHNLKTCTRQRKCRECQQVGHGVEQCPEYSMRQNEARQVLQNPRIIQTNTSPSLEVANIVPILSSTPVNELSISQNNVSDADFPPLGDPACVNDILASNKNAKEMLVSSEKEPSTVTELTDSNSSNDLVMAESATIVDENNEIVTDTDESETCEEKEKNINLKRKTNHNLSIISSPKSSRKEIG